VAAGPGTLVFDEVDAGIGGQAALAVGKALAELARRYQVVAVTHLAQVAAFAGTQVAVSKAERDGRTIALASPVAGEARVVELSRMLSGHPDSEAARMHAEELLQAAGAGRDDPARKPKASRDGPARKPQVAGDDPARKPQVAGDDPARKPRRGL
jgi:DNA repair protein RecN (Recombination protein N)